MADDEVLIKIAADIASAVEALSTLTEQMGDVVKSIGDVGEKSAESEDQTKSFWDTWVSGAENGTTASVAWGEQLSKSFDTLKEGVGDALKSLPNLISNSAALGDELFTMSNRLNISVDAIGQLKYISEQSGASMQGMARTIQGLGAAMQDTESKQAKAIERLGLSVAELKAGKPEEAYFKIIDAIKQTVPASEQAAVGMVALGKQFRSQTMLFKEDITGLRASYKELGMGAEDLQKLAEEGDRYADNLANIKLVQESWKNSIANALLPTINELLEKMPGLGGAVLTLGQGFMDTASSMLPLLGNIAMLKSSGLAATLAGWAGSIPGVSTAVGGLKVAFTGLTAALGPLAIALAGAAAIFMTWKAANAESGWIRGLSDKVEYAALRITGMSAAQADAAIATQHATQKSQEAAAAQKLHGAATEQGTVAVRAQVDGLAQLTAKQNEAKAQLAGLTAAQRSQISTLISQGVALKDISEASGVSTAALELFKKQLEATKKAAEDSPFTKLHKETKELAEGIKLATLAGAPLADQLDQFGKKSAEAMVKAAGLKGELAKVPPEVKAMADAFNAAQLAEKMTPLIEKALELAKAFGEKVTAAVKAAADAVKGMQNEMTLNMLSGSEKRIKQISIERDKAIESVKAQRDVQVKALADQEAAIKKNSDAERKAVADIKGLSKEVTDEKLANIKRDEDAAIASARAQSSAVQRQYDEQMGVVNEYYDQKVAIENKDTASFEKNAELRGVKTKTVYQAELKTQQETLDFMLANRDKFTIADIEKQRGVVEASEVSAGKMKVDWSSALDAINASFTQLATISGGAFGGMLKGIAEVSGGFGVMKSSFGSAASMFKGAGGLGGITGSFKNLSGGIGGLIGGITKGLGTVMPMAGAIIAGVGAAVKIGKKLWDGLTTSGGEKVAKEVGKKFGVTITEEMGDAINKSAKDLFKGDKFTAEIFHIGDIIKAAGGVTEKNFDKLLGNLGQVFTLVKQGKMTADQARQVLDQNFGAFAQHVLESGKVAGKQFQDILRMNKESGVQSAEVTGFVAMQTGRLGAALAKLGGAQEQTNESMGRFERLAVAGFNAAIAAGVPYLDAIEQMGPALDKIVEGNKKLGREGGAAIAELLKFREVATANQDLVESAGALNEVMLALSNTGALNTETMADLQAQGTDTFAQLTAAGFTEQQALQQMKGFLEQVRNAHEELGLPIDANTQALIAQAEGAGVLKAKQMDANDVMMTGFSAIIKALGGEIPAAFQKMADSGVKAAGDITGSMATATESTAGLQTAVDGVAEGQSPGGFRGLIARLKESMGAFTQFATTGTQSAAAVAGVVDTTLTPSLMKTTNELKMTPWDMWKTMGTVAAADTGAAVSTQLVPTIEETTEQLNATPWGEMAARASDAANKVGGVVNGVVGASILQTTDKIRATPWMEYAQRGIGAGTVSANAIKNVQSAIDSAAGELASSDWSGWADELASAAREAQEAVDAVSLGSSPGGLKEIPLKIAEARKAFAAFEEMGVGSAEEVKKSVDALSGAQATIGMAGGTATAASVAQTPLAGAASGGGETFHISIQALDASGVDQITESKLIPAIVRVLRKGGRGVSDVQGVLR